MIRKHRGETLTLAATASIGLPQVRNIPPGFNVLDVDPFHATTVEALLLAFGPKIERIAFFDASAGVGGTYVDLTEKLTDRNANALAAAGSGALLNAMTTSDFLYVCLHHSARGIGFDVVDANAIATTLVGAYLNVHDVWTDLSVTDGTASGGATFAIDGLVTWTVPAPELWVNRSLPEAQAVPNFLNGLRGYWVRFSVSDTLTNPTSIVSATALANINVDANPKTVRSEGEARVRIMSHNAARPMDRFHLDTSRYGSIEITSTALATAINLNWYEDR